MHRLWWTLPLTVSVAVMAMFGHLWGWMPMGARAGWNSRCRSPSPAGPAGRSSSGDAVGLEPHPNMWTLISKGTGSAFVYSVVTTVAPHVFPDSFVSMGGVSVTPAASRTRVPAPGPIAAGTRTVLVGLLRTIDRNCAGTLRRRSARRADPVAQRARRHGPARTVARRLRAEDPRTPEPARRRGSGPERNAGVDRPRDHRLRACLSGLPLRCAQPARLRTAATRSIRRRRHEVVVQAHGPGDGRWPPRLANVVYAGHSVVVSEWS
jgi:hypothetical protein